MRKVLKILFACWLTVVVNAQGQEVTFLSSDVEEGIRQHLCLGDNEPVCFLQLDTITTLDLSKRGITEIRDLVLLPNLHRLDLNNNMVSDLQPLTVLDSLEWVDLSFNNLKNINQLVYSNARTMTVNVAFNHIGDFSIFGSITRCNFILEGTGLQLYESAPYFDVCQLICDATTSPATVDGMIRTNMAEAARLTCGDFGMEVTADGNCFKQVLNGDYTETTPVFLNNGVLGDSTYLVPPITMEVESGETVTLPTGLPESFSIQLTKNTQGTVVINGTELEYTAPNMEVSDTISFCYSEYGVLKGFSHYCLEKIDVLLGDANGDKTVNVTDVMMIVNHIVRETPPSFVRRNADVNCDGNINVADVMQVVMIILNQTRPGAPANVMHDMEDKVILSGEGQSCSISLDGDSPFTACEMTLSLPNGCTLFDASLGSRQPGGHQMSVNDIGEGRYRIVVFAPEDGRTTLQNGALVNLGLVGNMDGIKVSDILFTNPRYETVILSGAIGVANAIGEITSERADDDIYSIQGVRTETPTRGVYIKDHKKKTVK